MRIYLLADRRYMGIRGDARMPAHRPRWGTDLSRGGGDGQVLAHPDAILGRL